MLENLSTRKVSIILLISLPLLILFYFVFSNFILTKNVEIIANTENYSVSINGNSPISCPEKICKTKLKIGTNTLLFSKDDFITQTIQYDVSFFKENKITAFLQIKPKLEILTDTLPATTPKYSYNIVSNSETGKIYLEQTEINSKNTAKPVAYFGRNITNYLLIPNSLENKILLIDQTNEKNQITYIIDLTTQARKNIFQSTKINSAKWLDSEKNIVLFNVIEQGKENLIIYKNQINSNFDLNTKFDLISTNSENKTIYYNTKTNSFDQLNLDQNTTIPLLTSDTTPPTQLTSINKKFYAKISEFYYSLTF